VLFKGFDPITQIVVGHEYTPVRQAPCSIL
jgi:hypothetical protein